MQVARDICGCGYNCYRVFLRRIAEMAVDPAFKGVGKKEGLEIFRIEVSDTVCMSRHVISVTAHFFSASHRM